MSAISAQPESSACTLTASEHTLVTWDGTELFYRAWLPAGPIERAVFLLHRGHEHSGRFADVVGELAMERTAYFAWDQRGHGHSPGPRGYAASLAAVVKDLDVFVRTLAQKHDFALENAAVVGHSIAAVTAAAWVHDYAPRVRAMVVLTPALRVKLYVPLAVPGLRIIQTVRGGRPAFVKSYVRSAMLTHDPREARRYDEDPLIARSIAVNMLLDLHDTSTRLLEDAGAIGTPTLVLSAGKDWVVRLSTQRKFFEQLGSADKQMHVFEEMYHDLLHEAGREQVTAAIRSFLAERFDRPPTPASATDGELGRSTEEEYDLLCRPLAALSPKRWWFAAQRMVMRSAGRLSDGIRLGWDTGFDSGQSLDYVYQNRPSGRLVIGKWADRAYLNAVGWRGIRQRKVNLQKLLRLAIERLRASGRPVRILDIAAGCGRYVVEAVASLPPGTVQSALLRDCKPENLAAGRELADELGLAAIEFREGDAFDEASLAAIDPPASVAVVSGLYELFPDNGMVLASLRGVAKALRDGGYLIYTGQPWHPQLEMIARVLDNRQGQPWIMRRRTQAELDALVRAAGFEKIDMEIDPWGIFTVSLARIRSDR